MQVPGLAACSMGKFLRLAHPISIFHAGTVSWAALEPQTGAAAAERAGQQCQGTAKMLRQSCMDLLSWDEQQEELAAANKVMRLGRLMAVGDELRTWGWPSDDGQVRVAHHTCGGRYQCSHC